MVLCSCRSSPRYRPTVWLRWPPWCSRGPTPSATPPWQRCVGGSEYTVLVDGWTTISTGSSWEINGDVMGYRTTCMNMYDVSVCAKFEVIIPRVLDKPSEWISDFNDHHWSTDSMQIVALFNFGALVLCFLHVVRVHPVVNFCAWLRWWLSAVCVSTRPESGPASLLELGLAKIRWWVNV